MRNNRRETKCLGVLAVKLFVRVFDVYVFDCLCDCFYVQHYGHLPRHQNEMLNAMTRSTPSLALACYLSGPATQARSIATEAVVHLSVCQFRALGRSAGGLRLAAKP